MPRILASMVVLVSTPATTASSANVLLASMDNIATFLAKLAPIVLASIMDFVSILNLDSSAAVLMVSKAKHVKSLSTSVTPTLATTEVLV